MSRHPHDNSTLTRALVLLGILAAALAVSARGLWGPELEGLDGAHHVMDGIFFHDLLTDFPLRHLVGYTFQYYKQYPALGFIFWPPLYAFVEGLFFKLGGISLFTAQFCILAYTLLLCTCLYRISRRFLPTGYGVAVVAVLLFSPGLYQYFNVVMLEIPTLAMMALTAMLYLDLVGSEQQQRSFWRWQCLALVAAMSLYTKQTAFILFPAIAIDLIVYRRPLLRRRETWFALVTAIILVLPLALFTLKFGKANIAQSIGNDTRLIMSGYKGTYRWSLANWLFYAKSFPHLVTLPVLILAVAEAVVSLINRQRLQQNMLWLAWVIAFYLIFSYFDNKSDRFAVLAAPPLVLLALNFLYNTMTFLADSSRRRWLEGGLLLALTAFGIWTVLPLRPVTMSGTHAIMHHLDVASMDGNIAYLGKYRQVFVYDIRLQDRKRDHYVLKGDDVFADATTAMQQLHDYRIRYLMVEPANLNQPERESLAKMENSGLVKTILKTQFKAGSHPYQLQVLAYSGPMPQTMKPISLSSKLIN